MSATDSIREYKKLLDEELIDSEEFDNLKKSALKQIPKGEDKVQLLREFKGLFDDGIITQEEFSEQKTRLLAEDKKTVAINLPSSEQITKGLESITAKGNKAVSSLGTNSTNKSKLPLKVIIPIIAVVVLLIIILIPKGSATPDYGKLLAGHTYEDGIGNYLIFESDNQVTRCIEYIDEGTYPQPYTVSYDAEKEQYCIYTAEDKTFEDKFYIIGTAEDGTPNALEYDYEPGWVFTLSK